MVHPSGRGEAVLAADRAHVWHPYSPAGAGVLVPPVVSAQAVRLRLADGRELIDGMSSWWAAIHGYRHPILDAAAVAQLGKMSHVMFGGLTHEPAVSLASLLVRITPEPLTQVFLCDSGSVSVEVALKMAIQYQAAIGHPERSRMLTIRRGYHGDTTGAMSVTDPVTGMHHLFRHLLPQHVFVPEPECGFSDPLTASDLAPMRDALESRQDVAAVILEPVVQGAGGMRFYSPHYLRAVRDLCDEHGVLLICDEIATGFGRTGRLFASEWAGISPDIMCLGKAMTGGYLTMAATLCTGAVARAISAGEGGAFMHGPTFMGNPLAAAIATASIELLLAQDWQAQVARLERELRLGLARARGLPGVTDVRVLGGIGVIEFTDPLDLGIATAQLVAAGVWLRPFGRLLYTMPPYSMDDIDLGRVTSAMVGVARRRGG
ncbi:MAG: adenosylmethionine---8-amino-7-oxononanoate aminotransferase [Cryptosporangiaceae bacterium]|nr:adenosylmethionine---8-amino-7-oxononanoate aminotransferase [Cryptosporangiaceae bacterium]